MITTSNVGVQLRRYRKQWGFTQEHLASLLQVKREQISYYENGERPVPLHHLNRIADVFGVELRDLVERDPTQASANMAIAFRADQISTQDTPAIADFRRIVKNYLRLAALNA